MPDNSQLLDLIARWEELRAAGHGISAEQLCQDCPELLPALQRRIEVLQALNSALGTKEGLKDTADFAAADPEKISISSDIPIIAGKATDRGAIPDIPGYEIVRELGRGGMGVVYLAKQAGLERLVALKMLLAGKYAALVERIRFKSEVEAIGRLQHPNLVQVFEVNEHDHRAYFSMEFMDGGTLDDKIDSRPQPARQAAALVETLARAMHVAHQHGVVHRDLKPANVLLTADGAPKITDFGLAKRLDVELGPTLTEHILGTPSYMAPEQAAGRSKQVGPGTDIYSLGAILYEMLTGRPPFDGVGAMDVVRQVIDEDPVPPRRLQTSVPIDLETICLKCLHKQPVQRYTSAADLADDLHRFLADEPIVARPIGWLGRLAKWARRRPAAAALIAVIGFAFIMALAAGSWFTHRLSAELDKTDQAKRDLELALVRQVAEGLDGDLRQLEMVPQSMAALLARRMSWKEDDLEAWTRTLVKKDDRVFGIGVAFEPGQFVGSRTYEDYALYVHEHAGGLITKQLLPPGYPPPFYREREWYKGAKLATHAMWTEPYIGQGADNTPMVSYSVPFYRDGAFSGVVTGDLSIKYFGGLHNRLQSLYLGTNSYSFVMSPKGTFIYHPNPLYEFPTQLSSLDRIKAAPDFLALVERMRQEETGRGEATDFNTGRHATFLFSRIPSTGWYFVVAHADPTAGK